MIYIKLMIELNDLVVLTEDIGFLDKNTICKVIEIQKPPFYIDLCYIVDTAWPSDERSDVTYLIFDHNCKLFSKYESGDLFVEHRNNTYTLQISDDKKTIQSAKINTTSDGRRIVMGIDVQSIAHFKFSGEISIHTIIVDDKNSTDGCVDMDIKIKGRNKNHPNLTYNTNCIFDFSKSPTVSNACEHLKKRPSYVMKYGEKVNFWYCPDCGEDVGLI